MLQKFYMCFVYFSVQWIYFKPFKLDIPTFHFEFLDPLSSFSVGCQSESNNANDSKKGDLSQLFGI